MFERSAREPGSAPQGTSPGVRLTQMAADVGASLPVEAEPPGMPGSRTGRLVERWVPPSLTGDPGSPRRRRLAVVAVALGVVAAVLITALLAGGRPTKESPPPLPTAKPVAAADGGDHPPASALVVSVVGKVGNPGLVTVPAGSRVADAVRAAGGLVEGADLLGLNLARRLVDGEQLSVGVPGPVGDATQPGAGAPAAKLDLNTASPEQLDTLPGVGQVTAKRIVDWRTRHGRFSTVEQLRDVDGIGESKFSKLRDQVTVA